jgi:hypothetical protein
MGKKRELNFLDKPRNIKILWISLYVSCGVLFILDLFIPRKTLFGFDGFFGFYSILGFISCAVLILVSKVLGIFLKVEEDYYDR